MGSPNSAAGVDASGELLVSKFLYTKRNLDLLKTTNQYLAAFCADFPNCEFWSLETSSFNFWCGLFAIQNSLLALHHKNSAVPVPELADLMRSRVEYASPEWKRFRMEGGILDPEDEMPSENFSSDELWLILKGWAVHLKLLNRKVWGGIQLGFVTPAKEGLALPLTLQLQEEIFKIPANESKRPILRVWILHNGEEHWEGIARVSVGTAKEQSLPLPLQRVDQKPATWPPLLLPNTVPSCTMEFQSYGAEAGMQPLPCTQHPPVPSDNAGMGLEVALEGFPHQSWTTSPGLQATFTFQKFPHPTWTTSPTLIFDHFLCPSMTITPALCPSHPIGPLFFPQETPNTLGWEEHTSTPQYLRTSPFFSVIEAADDGNFMPPMDSSLIDHLLPTPTHLYDAAEPPLLAATPEEEDHKQRQQQQPPQSQSQLQQREGEHEAHHMAAEPSMPQPQPQPSTPRSQPPPKRRRTKQRDDDPSPEQEKNGNYSDQERRRLSQLRRVRNHRIRKKMKDPKDQKVQKTQKEQKGQKRSPTI